MHFVKKSEEDLVSTQANEPPLLSPVLHFSVVSFQFYNTSEG